MFDFSDLKKRKPAFRDEHEPAVQRIFERCRASNPSEWTENYVVSAVEVLRPARVPLSPPMGQGLLESGFGKSKILFGIKARKCDVEAGLAFESPTKEIIDGKEITVVARFYKDKTMRAEFVHYLDLMRRVHPNFAKFYPAGREDYLRYIMRPGHAYATDDDPATPEIEYIEKVLSIVEKIGLEVFDRFEMYD